MPSKFDFMLSKPKMLPIRYSSLGTLEERKRSEIYASIMSNINHRIVFCSSFLANVNLSFPEKQSFELIQLNFRKICELIAASCLVADQEVRNVPKISIDSESKVGLILSTLFKRDKDFFPKSTLPDDFFSEEIRKLYAIRSLGWKEVKNYYEETHKFLHAGSLKNIESWYNNDSYAPLDWERCRKITLQFIHLLLRHVKKTSDGRFIHCKFPQYDGKSGYVIISHSADVPDVPDAPPF